MNLLSLILIAMAVIVAGCVFYVAWQFSSGEFETRHAREAADSLEEERRANADKEEPGKSKESKDLPGP